MVTKQAAVVAGIRGRIISGDWPAGSRLPAYPELTRMFGVSQITVEHAMRRLKHDGYVHARRRVGLFVADSPPHQSCCALAFGFRRQWGGESHWSLYHEALYQAAQQITASGSRRINCYFGLDWPGDSDDYRRLLADVRAHRVGGLIFAASPHHLTGTPLLAAAGMPKVAIYSKPAFPDIPAVVTNEHSFVDQALDWLAAQGRRHLALLSNAVYEADDATHRLSYFAEQASRRGLITSPAWMQCPSPFSALAIEHATLALLQTSLRGQPDTAVDGLVILDDNLVAPALAVVRSCDLRIPNDLAVVASGNFPALPPCPPAVRLIGYDAGKLLAACVHALDQQRAGSTPPEIQLLKAEPLAPLASVPQSPSRNTTSRSRSQ